MSKFKEAWDGAWKRTEQRLWVFAKMGKINPDGSYTFDVPGRATFVYVTLRSDSSTGGQTVVAARNDAGVEHAPRLNIKMRLEQGVYVIYGRTGREDLGSNPATPPSGVISHNHDDLYYEKTEFTNAGGTTDYANLPIKTTADGVIDPSLLPEVVTAFTDLSDAPSSYTGFGGDVLAVTATEDGIEFIDPIAVGLAAMPLVQTSVPAATVGTPSVSSFATKGVRLTPSKDMQIYGIAFVGNTVAGASYKPYCFTFGAGTVANLVTGTVYTVAASGEALTSKRHWLWFSSPISLTAGTEYGFAIGRTDSTNTYALPFETVSGYKIPFNNQSAENGYVRIAKAVPANGDTVDSLTTGDMFMMGFCWSFNDEAVTVYALPADVGGSVNAATTDNTLDDTDTLPYTTGSTLKKTAWSVIKSTLKTYFDTLYTFANIVANNSITNALLRDSGALSVIGRSANSSGDPADISATATSDAVLRESGSVLGFGTVATGGIAANAVTNAKAAQMAANTLKSNITGSTANAADNDITTVLAQYIHAATSKNPPVDADELALIDSAASNALKKLTWANLKAAIKTYYDSLATSLTNKTLDSTNIASLTTKNPPVDADSVVIVDSAASNVFKATTGTNLKAYLKTYFDGLYGLLAAANTWTNLNQFNPTNTTGVGLGVTRNLAAANTDSPVVSIQQTSTTDDQAALYVKQFIASFTIPTARFVHQGTGSMLVALENYSANASGNAGFAAYRARGTEASPTIVSASDVLGFVTFNGWDGAAWIAAAGWTVTVDGTPGTSDMPGRIDFFTTPDGSASGATVLRMNSLQQALVGGITSTGGNGYLATQAGTSGNDAAVGGVLSTQTGAVGNVGSGIDDLLSYGVVANTLAFNNQSLWFEAYGTLANNGNTKTVRVSWGSDTFIVIASTMDTSNTTWSIKGRIFRITSTTQKVFIDTMDTGDVVGNQGNIVSTGAQTLTSGTVTLKITGEGVSNNDIVCEALIVGWDDANS